MTASASPLAGAARPDLWDQPNAVILAAFEARRAHDSGATARSERGRIQAQLRRHAVQHGFPEPALRAVVH